MMQILSMRAVFAIGLGCLWLFAACSGEDNGGGYTPSCGVAKIVVDPVSGELVSGPPNVELDEITDVSLDPWPQSLTRIEIRDGFWRLEQDVVDKGAPAPETAVRILVWMSMQGYSEFTGWLDRLYDPTQADYLAFASSSCIAKEFGPEPQKLGRSIAYLEHYGLRVDRIAKNRMIFWATGTVAQVEAAFQTTLHSIVRIKRADYAALTPLTVPDFMAGHMEAVLGMQVLPTNLTPPPDPGTQETTVPSSGIRFSEIADVYGLSPLYQAGQKGKGQSIGIMAGWAGRMSDIQEYLRVMGIERTGAITDVYTDFPPEKFADETTVNTQLAAAIAPDADILLYHSADNTDLSLCWALNEAIGEGKVSAISTSYAHQEATVSWEIQEFMSRAARFAAAQGITFISASGDSREVDAPGNSPWVTSIGSTILTLDENGQRKTEVDAWFGGRGRSALFAKPDYQSALDPEGTRRLTVDLAMHCFPGNAEFAIMSYLRGTWFPNGGTSLVAPILAGMVGCVNQARGEKGRIGFINRALYTVPEFQASFYDVTTGLFDVGGKEVGKGWDYGTGWGAPNMSAWIPTIP